MNYEELVKQIKRIYSTLTSKSVEVILTYKGTDYGVSKPWNIKIDSREVNHISHELAAQELFATLKKELADRIAFTEKQNNELKKVLGSLPN